jgi:hypothetical protein
VGVLAIAVIVVAARLWLNQEGSKGDAGSPPAGAAGPASSPAPPLRTRVEPQSSGAGTEARKRAPVDASRQRTGSAATVAVTVVEVGLCRTLSTGAPVWHCSEAGRVVSPGPLFFYTRLQSARDTTVFYRGDRLQQEMALDVRANPESGYRAYSRKTVTADASGAWRVELRTADGRLLHEERFTVR